MTEVQCVARETLEKAAADLGEARLVSRQLQAAMAQEATRTEAKINIMLQEQQREAAEQLAEADKRAKQAIAAIPAGALADGRAVATVFDVLPSMGDDGKR